MWDVNKKKGTQKQWWGGNSRCQNCLFIFKSIVSEINVKQINLINYLYILSTCVLDIAKKDLRMGRIPVC